MTESAPEAVVTPGVELGEGPAWDDRHGVLVWVDIWAGRVHAYDPQTGHDEAVEVGQPVGAAVPRAAGGYALAVRDGFALLEPDGVVRNVAKVEDHIPGNRMNDGKCDRHGRFWAGTMAADQRPGAGALYRLDPDLSLTRVVAGVSISNGLAWSLDDTTLYFIDTPTQGVDAFDYDPSTGELEHRRRVIDVPPEAGAPDGMALDEEGLLWIALHGGGAIRRYSPDGALDRVVELPAINTTSCAFAGPELDDLYITSAREGLSADELARQPLAGALFRHRPGVRGVPTERFGG